MTEAALASPPTMDDIVALARSYAKARDALENTGEEIRQLQRKAVRDRLRGLRSRVAEAAAAHDALKAAIVGRPELFVRPRTIAVDGVKFGFRKQTGALDIGDEARSIKLLRQKLPKRADALINVKETLMTSSTFVDRSPTTEMVRRGLSPFAGRTMERSAHLRFPSIPPRPGTRSPLQRLKGLISIRPRP